MKRRTHSSPVPAPRRIEDWVDLPAIAAVVNEPFATLYAAVQELRSSQYREVEMFPEQHAGKKPQINREAVQQLLNDGTLSLRNYVVSLRGEHTRRPIELFCATYGITAPHTEPRAAISSQMSR